MSIYQCEECGCIENSALGHYHCRGQGMYRDKTKDPKKLCSACGPVEFKSGEIDPGHGKWHDRFKRRFFPKNSLYTDNEGNVRVIATKEYPDYEKASDVEID